MRGALVRNRENAVTSRTITLNDSECREVTAALELMIDHCEAFLANGPAFLRLAAPPKLKSDDAGAAGPVRGSEFFSGARVSVGAEACT